MSKPIKTINLEPNYTNVVYQFMRDATLHGDRFLTGEPTALSMFRNFVVSLNIAMQAMYNQETIQYVRSEIGKLSARCAAKDDEVK